MDLDTRAAVHAALGEPARLAIVDRLAWGDASPGELARQLGLGTNLLAHHLKILRSVGAIHRVRSEGDRRRHYVRLRMDNPTVLAATIPTVEWPAGHGQRVLFVCTANSARSQLAAAAWNATSPVPAVSAGTHPAPRVHPRTASAARRHSLRLGRAAPHAIAAVHRDADLVVAVCDNAYEEMDPGTVDLHWSVPDPVRQDTDAAFDAALLDITHRVQHVAGALTSVRPYVRSGVAPLSV